MPGLLLVLAPPKRPRLAPLAPLPPLPAPSGVPIAEVSAGNVADIPTVRPGARLVVCFGLKEVGEMRRVWAFAAVALVLACSESQPRRSPPASGGAGGSEAAQGEAGTTSKGGTGMAEGRTTYDSPGTKLNLTRSASTLQTLRADLDEVETMDAEELATEYAVPYEATLGYDPLSAQGLDLIQNSALGLNDEETAKLAAHGFVVVPRQAFPPRGEPCQNHGVTGFRTIRD